MDNVLLKCEPLVEALSRFSGRRALLLEREHSSMETVIARRFETVECLRTSLSNPVSSTTEPPRNVTTAELRNEFLPFADNEFELVVLNGVLDRVADWKTLLRECTRVLLQRGQLVVLEESGRVLNEQQINQLELERLMRDRDRALTGRENTPAGAEDVRAELRLREIHHLRVIEYSPLDYRLDMGTRQQYKRHCLERIKADLMPSLAYVGTKRAEFERRLIEVKRRLEVIGVEPPCLTLMFGMKKTTYASGDASLFAAESVTLEQDAPVQETVRTETTPELPPQSSELDAMQTADLLSLVMSGGDSPHRFSKLANRILKEYGSRAVADERNPDRLVETLRINKTRAMQIVAMFELGRRFFARLTEDFPVLRGPEDVFRYTSDMANLRREQFRGLYLNSRQRLVADEVISIGTLTSAILHPREVFRPAVTNRAASVIVVHNHPSGDPQPSQEDIEMTKQLAAAGRMLGIELLDHLIIGGDSCFSMKDAGLF